MQAGGHRHGQEYSEVNGGSEHRTDDCRLDYNEVGGGSEHRIDVCMLDYNEADCGGLEYRTDK